MFPITLFSSLNYEIKIFYHWKVTSNISAVKTVILMGKVKTQIKSNVYTSIMKKIALKVTSVPSPIPCSDLTIYPPRSKIPLHLVHSLCRAGFIVCSLCWPQSDLLLICNIVFWVWRVPQRLLCW